METKPHKIQPYIIVGYGRSGTTVTHLALKGHPNVSAVRDEIRIAPLFTQGMATFTVSGDKYLSAKEKENHISAIFNAITSLEADENTIASGLKVTAYSPKLASQLVESLQSHFKDIIVILTTRDDIVAQHGSEIRKRETGQAHSWRSIQGNSNFTVDIPNKEFVNYAKSVLSTVYELQKLKNTHQVIEINYEKDILPNTYHAYYKLFEALNLPLVEISWLNSSKVAPAPEKYIMNYLELKEILGNLKKDSKYKLSNKVEEVTKSADSPPNLNLKKLKSKVKKIISVILE